MQPQPGETPVPGTRVKSTNRLLALLPAEEHLALQSAGDEVELELPSVLMEAGHKATAVYFPLSGFISLIATLPSHPGLEVGMVGREGMLGVHLALGNANSPLRAIVQGQGAALRITSAKFMTVLTQCPIFHTLLQRYVQLMLVQLARSCACQRFHAIDARLARWLLMSQDRAQCDQFEMTQEFLAYMLGVRRVSITNAASALQAQGLIAYRRGHIEIRDRPQLLKLACTCYAQNQASYKTHVHLRNSASSLL